MSGPEILGSWWRSKVEQASTVRALWFGLMELPEAEGARWNLYVSGCREFTQADDSGDRRSDAADPRGPIGGPAVSRWPSLASCQDLQSRRTPTVRQALADLPCGWPRRICNGWRLAVHAPTQRPTMSGIGAPQRSGTAFRDQRCAFATMANLPVWTDHAECGPDIAPRAGTRLPRPRAGMSAEEPQRSRGACPAPPVDHDTGRWGTPPPSVSGLVAGGTISAPREPWSSTRHRDTSRPVRRP